MPTPTPKWPISVNRMIVEIPRVIIEEIRAHPTRSMGWFNAKLRKAWKLLLPANADECSFGVSSSDRLGMGTDGRAVVEVPLRHARLGGSEQIDMEHHFVGLSVFDSE